MPNLFGDVDAADIPDDPFYVAPGTYDCTVIDAAFVERKDHQGHGLSIKYQINESESEYDGNTIQEWKNVYPNLTPEEITPEIKRHLSFVKQRLSQLGVPPAEQNGILDNVTDLIGIECVVTVTETPSKEGDRVFTNVRTVSLPDNA